MKIINTFMCEGIAQQDLVNQQLQMLNNHSDNITGEEKTVILWISSKTLFLLFSVFTHSTFY